MRFIVDVAFPDDAAWPNPPAITTALGLVNIPAHVLRAEKDGREGESQPMPTITEGQDIQSMVIEDINARREVGIQRYGTALQANNGRDALADAYDEALDLACYLKQALVERADN